MRAPWKRAAAIALATCGLTSFSLLSGCKTDIEKSTDAVSAEVEKAATTLTQSDPGAATTAATSLKKAADSKSDTPETQIEANSLLAQAEVAQADQIISGSPDKPGIAQKQASILSLLGDISTLALELDLNNTRLAGYRALEPVDARKAVDQVVSAAQKGDNGAWVAGTAPIPSLDAVKQKEQDLQKQIDDLTHQRDDLNAKRSQALADAGKFGQQADSTSGKESVGFYTQASNARKDAADNETKIQDLESQLVPLQQDLALAQLQEKAITDIVTGFGDQTQQLDNGWKAVQSKIDDATAFAKSLVEGTGGADASAPPPAPAPTPAPAGSSDATAATPAPAAPPTPRNITALATELDRQLQDVQHDRSAAIDLLNSAFKHYDNARNIAKTLNLKLTGLSAGSDSLKLPERHADQELIAVNSTARFELQQAAIQGRLARLFADQFALATKRVGLAKQLDPIFKQSGITPPAVLATVLPVPGVLPSDVDSKIKGYEGDLKSDAPPFDTDASGLVDLATAQPAPIAQQAISAAQADVAYAWSQSLLKDAIANAGQGDLAALLANVGHVATMTDDYGQSKLALLQGKDQDASAQIKLALGERDGLVDANEKILLPPVLPAELAFPPQPVGPQTPKPPTPAPAAGDQGAAPPPATPPAVPATAPADNTTPPATAPATPPAADNGAAPATPPATAPADTTAPPAATPPATPPADGSTPPPATPPATPPAGGTTPPAQ